MSDFWKKQVWILSERIEKNRKIELKFENYTSKNLKMTNIEKAELNFEIYILKHPKMSKTE